MELPARVIQSRLWGRLHGRSDYEHAISGIRQLAEAIAGLAKHTLPEYTDHSVKHMDALWAVADQVLSAEESEHLSVADPLEGSLDNLFEELEKTSPKFVLLPLLLKIVGESWGQDVKSLRGQRWRLGYENNILWADLSKTPRS